jgi:hypothetical protein
MMLLVSIIKRRKPMTKWLRRLRMPKKLSMSMARRRRTMMRKDKIMFHFTNYRA